MDGPFLPSPVPRAWIVVGHYFRILALVSLLTVPAGLFQKHGIQVDLTFIFLFWIGRGLFEGRKGPWRFAVGACGLILFASLGGMVMNLAFPSLGWDSVSLTTDSRLYAVVQTGLTVLFILPPLLLLLKPSLIREESGEDPANSDPRLWTAERIRTYLLGALLLGALIGGQQIMTGKLALQRSMTSLPMKSGAMGMMVVSVVQEEGGTKPRFVSSLAYGESPQGGMSNLLVTLGSTQVRLPDARVGRYLRILESPGEPVEEPNILLVKADGTILRVNRRVTLQSLKAVESLVPKAADLDDLKVRIEELLSAHAQK
jgi:hypothetical protein